MSRPVSVILSFGWPSFANITMLTAGHVVGSCRTSDISQTQIGTMAPMSDMPESRVAGLKVYELLPIQ